MNMYVYAVIPLIVILSIGLPFTAYLTLQVLSSFDARSLFVTLLNFIVYGVLAWFAVEFKVIENALATILTLSAALLSRAVGLSESYREYKHLIKNSESGTGDVKSLVSRFFEIAPDIVLVVLLLVIARDISEKYKIGNAEKFIIYAIEYLYVAVLFSYIGIGDKKNEIIKNRNKDKRFN
ncbi:hypothetical protein C1Y42_22410 [Pantoea sp. ICBG 985]|uniref:hypothetical protein n=1 Tax=Pantoea sp. ICBG 985 TaxID=2071683 RepID=UPI000CE3A4A5|nr:hypothetical protein [Pantoea sp. ICBG 985]PPC67098.1 hypothetical protein C1Y42_22410 [Pantoea sp. ICBG 985]